MNHNKINLVWNREAKKREHYLISIYYLLILMLSIYSLFIDLMNQYVLNVSDMLSTQALSYEVELGESKLKDKTFIFGHFIFKEGLQILKHID